MLKNAFRNKKIVIVVIAVIVLIVGGIIAMISSSLKDDKTNQNPHYELSENETDDSTEEDVPYEPDGMEVVEDNDTVVMDGVDAPTSWGESTEEEPLQNSNSATDNSSKGESPDKEQGNSSDESDENGSNNDKDGLPEDEDKSDTNWGTVF